MGLDFGIEKRRKGENYKGLSFEECCSWRNCHEVKRIFSETIEFDDTYYSPIFNRCNADFDQEID